MFLSDLKNLKSALIEISKTSPEYPQEWLALSDSPERLYALGNTNLLSARKLAVVGSRRTPTAILKFGAELCKELSYAFVLVTGTADGGDSAAIEGALSGNGKVICLLAGGFSALPQGNLPLMERVAKKGLLLSPYPFETETRAFSYEYRNKLLASLCEGTAVLSAGEKSGALITAKYAEKYGKPVFALPYPPNAAAGAGCNALLKKGARLTDCAQDILQVFGIQKESIRKQIPLSEDEQKLYQALQDLGESHVSELCQKSGVAPFKARAVLSALEVKGLAVSVGGNRYTAV